jgi:hypothetical protein
VKLRFSLSAAGLTGNAGDIAIVVSDSKQSGLLGGVPLQLVQIQFAGIAGGSHWFFGLALDAAFSLVALLLLAGVFLLAFRKA